MCKLSKRRQRFLPQTSGSPRCRGNEVRAGLAPRAVDALAERAPRIEVLKEGEPGRAVAVVPVPDSGVGRGDDVSVQPGAVNPAQAQELAPTLDVADAICDIVSNPVKAIAAIAIPNRKSWGAGQ